MGHNVVAVRVCVCVCDFRLRKREPNRVAGPRRVPPTLSQPPHNIMVKKESLFVESARTETPCVGGWKYCSASERDEIGHHHSWRKWKGVVEQEEEKKKIERAVCRAEWSE